MGVWIGFPVCPLLRSAEVVKVLLASLWFLFNCKIPGCHGRTLTGPGPRSDQRHLLGLARMAWLGLAAYLRQAKVVYGADWVRQKFSYLPVGADNTLWLDYDYKAADHRPSRFMEALQRWRAGGQELIQIGSAVSWLWQVLWLNHHLFIWPKV